MEFSGVRHLGLDIGTDRIGVALSDETGLIAQPLTVIASGGRESEWIEEVKELVEAHEVGAVVIGAPMSLSGQERGKSAIMARKAGQKIEAATGVSVIYWDERFTTAQAERVLVGARVRRNKRRQVVDKVAASIILQSFLDAQTRGE